MRLTENMANFYIAIYLYVAVFSYVDGKSWVIPENWSPSQSGQISRSTDLTKALEFVTRAESEMHEASIKMANLRWNYQSNITEETEAIYLEYKVNYFKKLATILRSMKSSIVKAIRVVEC